jgi:hypothetical protein
MKGLRLNGPKEHCTSASCARMTFAFLQERSRLQSALLLSFPCKSLVTPSIRFRASRFVSWPFLSQEEKAELSRAGLGVCSSPFAQLHMEGSCKNAFKETDLMYHVDIHVSFVQLLKAELASILSDFPFCWDNV